MNTVNYLESQDWNLKPPYQRQRHCDVCGDELQGTCHFGLLSGEGEEPYRVCADCRSALAVEFDPQQPQDRRQWCYLRHRAGDP